MSPKRKVRKNPDEDIRALEREWEATYDPSAGRALYSAYLRLGHTDPGAPPLNTLLSHAKPFRMEAPMNNHQVVEHLTRIGFRLLNNYLVQYTSEPFAGAEYKFPDEYALVDREHRAQWGKHIHSESHASPARFVTLDVYARPAGYGIRFSHVWPFIFENYPVRGVTRTAQINHILSRPELIDAGVVRTSYFEMSLPSPDEAAADARRWFIMGEEEAGSNFCCSDAAEGFDCTCEK